jgi:glutamine---fructose-6-phosphate transaminase (isomerizing)
MSEPERPPQGGTDTYLAEILGQPAAFLRAAAAVARQESVLRGLAEAAAAGGVLLAGMGSSLDACAAAGAVLGAAGVPVSVLEAAELLHVRRALLGTARLVILVSQSGESPEVVQLAAAVADLSGSRPVTLGVVNGAGSPLASAADLVLDTAVGPEACPSSTTFAGALVALAAVAGILRGMPPEAAVAAAHDEASKAATAASALLANPAALEARLAAWLGARRTVVLLGRGTGLAAAEMGALTLQEAAALPALAMPTAEFRHGPMEIVGPGVAVVLFALEPATIDLDRSFGAELAAAQAAVLLVAPAGAGGRPAAAGVSMVDLPGSAAGMCSAGVALVPVQLLARHLAAVAGRVPGTFTLAAKVTVRE